MQAVTSESVVRNLVERHFALAGLVPKSINVRTFPGETIAVVEVENEYERAVVLAGELDEKIEDGFVTVRRVEPRAKKRKSLGPVKSVHDERIATLIELMNARARTSENQPSLRYVQDVEERLNLAVSPRHHLIFGRRGVGKTALLLEAKRSLENQGKYVLWVNMHPLRGLDSKDAFLTVASRICDLGIGVFRGGGVMPASVSLLESARSMVEQQRYDERSTLEKSSSLVPILQQAISRFCLESQHPVYIFLDDIHYLPTTQVPQFLDLLHGITRDNPVWLKVAGIQHQTRWFIPSPPTGLQTGHDAAIINLDVTLEHPERAKQFLQDVLRGYVDECDASPFSSFLSVPAVDRLVLASGGVPRDFLTLCAASLQTARQRTNAKTVGVQDVNNAAGTAAQIKLQELEDDAAAEIGRSENLVSTLDRIRDFLLNEKQITFFRVDFRDKEAHATEYRLLQALADLRMLHLIYASLSDPHRAGRRSEVYLLDLSQYSGSRLKQKLKVLNFERGHLVLKRTRSSEPSRVGDSSLRLLSLLRTGPMFELEELSDFTERAQ